MLVFALASLSLAGCEDVRPLVRVYKPACPGEVYCELVRKDDGKLVERIELREALVKRDYSCMPDEDIAVLLELIDAATQ